MLADDCPERGSKSPETLGDTPVCLHLYVADADAIFANVIVSGAEQIKPVENQFYGDRSGMFTDPFGHAWNVATHVEDVSPELHNRMAAINKSSTKDLCNLGGPQSRGPPRRVLSYLRLPSIR
jgi:PhnB protein